MFDFIHFYLHIFKLALLLPIQKLLLRAIAPPLPGLPSDSQAALLLLLLLRLQILVVSVDTALQAIVKSSREHDRAVVSEFFKLSASWLLPLIFVILLVPFGVLAYQRRSKFKHEKDVLDFACEVTYSAVTPLIDTLGEPSTFPPIISDSDSSGSFSSSSYFDIAKCNPSSYYVNQKHTQLFLDGTYSPSEYLDAVYGPQETSLGYDGRGAQIQDPLFLDSLPDLEHYKTFSEYDKQLAVKNFRAVTLLDYKGQIEEIRVKWDSWKLKLEATLAVILLDSESTSDTSFLDVVSLIGLYFLHGSDSLNFDLFSVCFNGLVKNLDSRPLLVGPIIRSCCCMISAICPSGFVRILQQDIDFSPRNGVIVHCIRFYLLANYNRLLEDFQQVIGLLQAFQIIAKDIEAQLTKNKSIEELNSENREKSVDTSTSGHTTPPRYSYPIGFVLAEASDAADTYLICNKFFLGKYYKSISKYQRQIIFGHLKNIHNSILNALKVSTQESQPLLVEPGLQPDCI